MTDVEQEQAPDKMQLKRVMGPGLLLLFIIGDVLGTGIYALTGQVAAEVGGVVWLPFLIAFSVALLTACSYLELVTKYPQAAGAALYTHKAFNIHFVTFSGDLHCHFVGDHVLGHRIQGLRGKFRDCIRTGRRRL